MPDTYYANGDIDAHVCPICEAWVIEAPLTWDLSEIYAEMQVHVKACLGLPPDAPIPITITR